MTQTAPSPVAWRTATFAVFLINGLSIGSWISRIPGVRDALEISVSQVGVLLFGLAGGAIAGLLIAGHVVHLLGGRRTTLIVLLTAAFALAVIGIGSEVAHSYALVLAGAALFGFANSILDVAMNVEGSGVEHATGSNIMPWFHAAWSLGTVGGAAIGAAAALAGIGVLPHLMVIALVTAIGAVIATRWLPALELPEDGAPARPNFRERMGAWLEPRTLLLGVIILGMAFAEGSASDWLALAMVDDRGLDNGGGALVFGVFTVAMTIGRIVGVSLLNRYGRVVVLRGAAVASLIGLGLVILVPAIPIVIAGTVLWGLGASLGFPVGMSAAGDDPTKAAGRVSAVATIAYTGFLVGPPIIGLVAEQIGLLNSLWIVFGLIALSMLAIPAARPLQPAVSPRSGA